MNLQPVDFKAIASKGCFVYCYLRESDWTPYYVGLATGADRHRRPTDPHTVKVPKDRTRIRVMRAGLTKEEAVHWEKFFISHYGRKDMGTGILRNATPGGDGNLEMSETTRAKISSAKKGVSTPAIRAAAKKRGNTRGPLTLREKAEARALLALFSGTPEVVKAHRLTKLEKSHKDAGSSVGLEEWTKMNKAERRALRNNTKAAALLGIPVDAYCALSREEKISLTRIRKHELGILGTRRTSSLAA